MGFKKGLLKFKYIFEYNFNNKGMLAVFSSNTASTHTPAVLK